MPKFARRAEVNDKIRVLSREVWEELEKKHEKTVFTATLDQLKLQIDD